MADSRPAPFIVTAELPRDLFAWADGLRRAHFPPERNKLQAHVTLFHAFAPSLRDELLPLLKAIAARHAPVPARLTGALMPLGTGTALALESPAMLCLRSMVAEHFHGALTVQDQHEPRLHITVQNKVEPAAAKALQRQLSGTFPARDFTFTGLGLHLYLGGPWEAAGIFPFRGKEMVDRAGR
ncbi:2'-5' RNA ligase family protein [Novosphingobium flavum]|uniref:2'-5' RNA ligase family protein n=1 Tax=Novosphingobium flavum TaxID=1778672 RepID=UPI0031B5E53E